ncbi:50S ribosomal protein L31 [Bacilli bacterium]|nr:50S ribosomal protein L31 [Bacilli bacterium]
MPKKDIHPECHSIGVVLSDGRTINMKSVWGKDGDVMKLDVDPINHPAWKTDKSTFVNVNNNQVSKFKKKYGSTFA